MQHSRHMQFTVLVDGSHSAHHCLLHSSPSSCSACGAHEGNNSADARELQGGISSYIAGAPVQAKRQENTKSAACPDAEIEAKLNTYICAGNAIWVTWQLLVPAAEARGASNIGSYLLPGSFAAAIWLRLTMGHQAVLPPKVGLPLLPV